MRKKLRPRFDLCVYVFFAVFYLWMAAQVPYTHDDWDWGISNGIYYLLNGNINGRYAGNLFVVIMTRSQLLKTLIMGVCYFLIPFLLARFAAKGEKNHQAVLFLACNFLILTMNTGIWQQTYGWVSGFANFVISAVFMMIWVQEVFRVCETPLETQPVSRRYTFGCVLGCTVGQLFLENLALFCVILSVLLCILWYIRTKKVPLHALLMTAGAVVGLLIIFSSDVYDALFSTGEAIAGYRQVPMFSGENTGSVFAKLWNQTLTLLPLIFGNNRPICLAVLLLLIWLVLDKHSELPLMGKVLCTAANLALMLYFLLQYRLGGSWHSAAVQAAVSLVYFLIAAAETILLFRRDKWRMWKMLILWCSAPMVIAPLAVTNEAGSRLFFNSNVFAVLFAAMLLARILETASPKTFRRVLCLCLVILIPVVLHFGIVYYEIGACQDARDALIAWAGEYGSFTLELPKFPHAEYLWLPDPAGYNDLLFKYFYGIADYVELSFQ